MPPPRRPTWGQSTSCPAAPTWPECAPGWARAPGSPGGRARGAQRFAGTPSQVRGREGRPPSAGRAAHWAPRRKESGVHTAGSAHLRRVFPVASLARPPPAALQRQPSGLLAQGSRVCLVITTLGVTVAFCAAVFAGELHPARTKHHSCEQSPDPDTGRCPRSHSGRRV